jgi:hypothetical protein
MADTPQIMLNLDTVDERKYAPYVFAVGGKTFTFTDPSVLDWQVVEDLTTLDALARHCMSAEDRKAFYTTPLASYKLGVLFEDVQRHFELGTYAPKRRNR